MQSPAHLRFEDGPTIQFLHTVSMERLYGHPYPAHASPFAFDVMPSLIQFPFDAPLQ
jgi:hypothetical protein